MKKSTVVIALLAVLAIVFGILFITGNNEKNDLQAKVDELNTVVKSAADQGKAEDHRHRIYPVPGWISLPSVPAPYQEGQLRHRIRLQR